MRIHLYISQYIIFFSLSRKWKILYHYDLFSFHHISCIFHIYRYTVEKNKKEFKNFNFFMKIFFSKKESFLKKDKKIIIEEIIFFTILYLKNEKYITRKGIKNSKNLRVYIWKSCYMKIWRRCENWYSKWDSDLRST